MDLLADKMDELLELGVLATPLFSSSPMLVPKPDPGGRWRFVTDFTQLNNYIPKTPAISPSIEKANFKSPLLNSCHVLNSANIMNGF